MSTLLFLTIVSSAEEARGARLLIDSLRTFGGKLTASPFWIFAPDLEPVRALEDERTCLLPLAAPDLVLAYPFGMKVAACARAEELAPAGTRALVCIDTSCLIAQPPLLFDLDEDFDAALRPVHIRNVGLPASAPLDEFWQGIYNSVGIDDLHSTVDSFVEGQHLRAYFNSHSLTVNPGKGLFQRWYELFQRLLANPDFQSRACADEVHQIFLFQALFSALVATSLDLQRLRILPPTYNYPYNLQAKVPEALRAAALNDLVCFTYEGRSLHPETVADIQVREPLRSWLQARIQK